MTPVPMVVAGPLVCRPLARGGNGLWLCGHPGLVRAEWVHGLFALDEYR
jgi:hypothetical protein